MHKITTTKKEKKERKIVLYQAAYAYLFPAYLERHISVGE
jgi:hypothetical protein